MAEDIVRLKPAAARKLIFNALTGAGTAPQNATYFTEAILDTELSGLEGHGFYWLQFYCAHVQSGKVKGKATPKVIKRSPVSFIVDPMGGFAHPAIEKGFEKLIPAAKKYGIAGLGLTNSYNAATLGFHTGYLAKRGLLAFGFTNANAIMAPVGGRKPVIGTNPLSFAVPGKPGKIAFLVDQSSTAVTWTAVKRAAEDGREIPLGWALDASGAPPPTPRKALPDRSRPPAAPAASARASSSKSCARLSRVQASAPTWAASRPTTNTSAAASSSSPSSPPCSRAAPSRNRSRPSRSPSPRRTAPASPMRAERPISSGCRKRESPSARHCSRSSRASPARPMRPAPRHRRRAADIVQKPWAQLENPLPPLRLISDDEVEAIHRAALKLLETVGVRCAVEEARDIFARAGALIDGTDNRVRLGPEIVEAALSTAPSDLTLTPRNPARTVKLGGRYLTTAAVLGPPNCTDLIRGRRSGSLADLSELLQLTQHFNAVQMNGWPVEPLDIEVRFRHLEAARAMLTLTDKVPYVFCQSRQRIEDVLTMCAIARGETLEQFAERPGVFSIINTNTPLQYDVPMTIGVMDMARYGQPTLLTPFIMAGASTPATIASAMALNTAEILFGLTLAQLVRPGAPVLYGCAAMPVDMRTGAPAMGLPTCSAAPSSAGRSRASTASHALLEFQCRQHPGFRERL